LTSSPVAFRLIFLAVLTNIAIVACGGNGGSPVAGGTSTTSGTSTGGGNGSSPTSAIRSNLSGDRFNYTITGVYSQPGVTSNQPCSGTSSEIYSADTFNGQSAIEDVNSILLQVGSEPIVFTDTRQENAQGVTLAQSDDGASKAGAPFAILSSAFVSPTSLTSSYAFTGTEGLADGTTIQEQASVTGFQMVTTPAGSFNCWSLTINQNWSDNFTVSKTIQFSPDLGTVVQEVVTTNSLNNYSTVLTITLSSYTLG
jgi:hypothetical protein